MNDLLVIIPSRGRPDALERLVEEWDVTSDGLARLLVCLDVDDESRHRYPAKVATSVRRRNGFAPRLSAEALEAAPHHYALASWGDDHLPRTPHWDTILLEELERLGTGFAYGDDLLAGAALPTACAMTSDIVSTLGWMTPPGMAHLFVDNVWLELGRELDRITYLPDVIIEHMHPVSGKSEWDQLVRDANTPAAYNADRSVFNHWLLDSKAANVEKLRTLL